MGNKKAKAVPQRKEQRAMLYPLMVDPETFDALQSAAAKAGVTPGQLVSQALLIAIHSPVSTKKAAIALAQGESCTIELEADGE